FPTRRSSDLQASGLQDSVRAEQPHNETAKMAVLLSPANPSRPANAKTEGRLRPTPATIRRFVRVSTTLCRQLAQTDSDTTVLECNAAARRERDCSPGATACRDRYARVSIQNAASTDSRRVRPLQRTRFASQSAVGTAPRMAASGSDHLVLL